MAGVYLPDSIVPRYYVDKSPQGEYRIDDSKQIVVPRYIVKPGASGKSYGVYEAGKPVLSIYRIEKRGAEDLEPVKKNPFIVNASLFRRLILVSCKDSLKAFFLTFLNFQSHLSILKTPLQAVTQTFERRFARLSQRRFHADLYSCS